MKTNYLALSLLAIAALAGCAQQQQPQSPGSQQAMAMAMPDLAKEEAAIRATDAQWLAAVKARDAEKAAAFWSDDASIIMPNAAPVTGKKAIRDYVAESFKSPDFSITWATDKVEVARSGEMAYATGVSQITFRAGKQLVTVKNNGFGVWKKQADGQWKVAVDIATPQPQPVSANGSQK